MWDNPLIRLYAGFTFMFFFVVFILLWIFFKSRRKLNEYHKRQEMLLLANVEEGERMMNQIAKEVHDNIGQLSNLLRMTLRRLEKTTDKDELSKLFENANHFTELIISNADNINHSLNSDFIKKRGLFNIIQDDVERIKTTSKIGCSLKMSGNIITMNPDTELIVYRIAQEAMSNALKHSGATEIEVLLQSSDNTFTMSIKDNGRGFDKNDTKHTHGCGLTNMTQRAKMVKGELAINTIPDAGCEVVLSIENCQNIGNQP